MKLQSSSFKFQKRQHQALIIIMYKHMEFHGKCKNRIMPTKPVDSYKDDKVSEWRKYLASASSSKMNN